MSDREQCVLCDRVDHDVQPRHVRWTDVEQRRRGVPWVDVVLRCPDRQACRARVEAAGGTWPIRDAVTRPTVKPTPENEEVPI